MLSCLPIVGARGTDEWKKAGRRDVRRGGGQCGAKCKVWVKYFFSSLPRYISSSANFYNFLFCPRKWNFFIVKLLLLASIRYAALAAAVCLSPASWVTIDTSTKSVSLLSSCENWSLLSWKKERGNSKNYFLSIFNPPHKSGTSDQYLVVNCSSLSFSLLPQRREFSRFFSISPLALLFFFYPVFPHTMQIDIFDSIQPRKKERIHEINFISTISSTPQFQCCSSMDGGRWELAKKSFNCDSPCSRWRYLQF